MLWEGFWFVRAAGIDNCPMSQFAVVALLARGAIDLDTLIRPASDDAWRPIRRDEQFARWLPTAPPIPQPLPQLGSERDSPPRMDILPGLGIGPIRLGMHPDEARAVFHEPNVYEKWMGGNLNGDLTYRGLVLMFDDCGSRGPLPESRISDIQIVDRDDAYLFDCPMGEWNCGNIVAALTARGLEGEIDSSTIEVATAKLSLSFGKEHRLSAVWMS